MDILKTDTAKNDKSPPDFPQGLAWLLERLNKYDYIISEDELIKSFIWISLTAILSNEVNQLWRRLSILLNIDCETLAQEMQNAKHKMMHLILDTRREIQQDLAHEFNIPPGTNIKSFENSLNYHQKQHFHERVHSAIDSKKNMFDYAKAQQLVDVLALLESLDLYQTANRHAGIKQTIKTNFNLGFTNPLIVPSRLQQHGGLVEAKYFSGYYSVDELTIYFRTLRKTLGEILKFQIPFALTLNTSNHSLAVGIVEDEWIVIDFKALDFDPLRDEHEVAEKVFLSLAYPHAHSLFLSTKIYAAKKNLPEVQMSLDTWTSMPEFILIHK